MSDDPSLVWSEAVDLTIQVDQAADAWHAGHVSDVLTLADGGVFAGLAVATDTGGVWLLPRSGGGIPLSGTWDTPDLRCLAPGPDHARHLYAGGGRPNQLTSPRLVSWAVGRLDAFALGRDGALWHSWGDGTTWASWESLGGEIISAPAIVSWAPERLDIFVVGVDGQLFHKAWDGSQWLPSASGWTPLGGAVVGAPAAVSWGPERLDVVAVHPDRSLRHLSGDGSSWSDWESLGGAVVGTPAAVSWGPERLDLFVAGTNAKIFHKAWDGSAWLPSPTAWGPLGGDMLASPTAVSWGENRLDVFAVHATQDLQHISGDGTTFSEWESLGGTIVGSSAPVSWDTDRLDIFVAGRDAGTYRKSWDGTQWLPSQAVWAPLEGRLQGTPSAASWGVGRLDVVVLGSDGRLYHKGWEPSLATPPGDWTPLPPLFVGALHETDNSASAPITSWHELPLPVNDYVHDIVVLAKERRIVLATGDGVWWASIPKPPTSAGTYVWKRARGLPDGAFSGLALGPGGSVVVGAEGAQPLTGLFGIFRGEWAGDELTMSRATITGVDAKQMERTVLASCEKDLQRMYAAAGGPGDQLFAILRSSDGGKNWSACGLKVDGDAKGNSLPFFTGNQSRYNNAIDVSHVDPRTIALGWRSGPYVSTNGGDSWSPKGMGWQGSAWVFTSPHLHGDVHAVLFDRTDSSGKRLYVGSDGGVAVTSDLGDTFTSEENMQLRCLQHQTYPARAFNGSFSASSKDAGLVGSGLQDNGVVYAKAGTEGSRWRALAGGDGIFAAFIATGHLVYNWNSAVAFRAASWNGSELSAGSVIPITVTKSGGPPDPAGVGPPSGTQPVVSVPQPAERNAAGQLMYALAAQGSDIYGLYAAGDGSAMHWEYLTSVGTAFGENVTAIRTRDGREVLIGTSKGRIFGHDRETTFTLEHLVTPRPEAEGGIFHFLVKSAGRAFAILDAGTNGYLLRLDAGVWRPLDGLPNETLFGLAGNPDGKTLFVSTDCRVYVSRDDGLSWRRASKGLDRRPHCGDLRLVGTGTKKTLFLSTYGRSLWRASVSE